MMITIYKGGSRAATSEANRKRAFARLTGEQILAGLSEEQKAALAVKLGVKASKAPAPASTSTATAAAAPAKAAVKPANTTYADGLGKGFLAGRDVERARIKQVAEVALERGQAADALRMLATDAETSAIIAKLKEANLLADAMRARFGETGQ